MSSTGTRKQRSVQDRANESIIETDKQMINEFKVFAESSNAVAGLAGPAANNSPKTPAGNYLAREGDSMIGPIAFGPPLDFTIDIDANNTIDIGPLGDNPQYTSNIQIDDMPTSATLDIIANANFDGQLLIIRTFAPPVGGITISQATMANGGNIQTPDGNDITLEDLQMIALVFDESLVVFGNTGGTWRVLSGVGGGGTTGTGTFISAALSADQTTNLAVNDHIEFDTNTPPTGADGGIVLQTGAGQADGIFELLANKTYFLAGAVKPEFSAANAVELVWYDITNSQEIGVRTIYDSASLAQNQPLNGIIFTPTTDVDVELRIAAITTPANLTSINSDFTQGHIYEFSGMTTTITPEPSSWKNPVRAATVAAGTLSTDFENGDVLDGVTLATGDRILIKNQAAGAENGIYTVNATGAPTRADDFNTNDLVVSESFVAVEEGDTQENSVWHLITNNPIIVGTTVQVWEQFGSVKTVGPDLGQDSEGFDNTGSFVFDGRIFAGYQMLKRWEQFYDEVLPDGQLLDAIYLPSQEQLTVDQPLIPGRIVYCGNGNADVMASQIVIVTSDDYNETTTTRSTSSNIQYRRLAYDPGGDILITVGDRTTAGSPGASGILRSTDRGTTWGAVGPTGVEFYDVVWSENDSQFVALTFQGTTGAIYTSPTGATGTWTLRTTPAPTGAGFWRLLAYSEDKDLYMITGIIAGDVATSSDGITWTKITVTTSFNPFGAFKLLHSDGHGKWLAMSNTLGLHISEDDGVTWTTNTLPSSPTIRGFTIAPDLSLFVAMGQDVSSGIPLWWASNDGVEWFTMPVNSMRIQDTDATNNLGWGSTNQFVAVVYAQEWGAFFGAGMNQNQTTSVSYRLYRTDVQLNTRLAGTELP